MQETFFYCHLKNCHITKLDFCKYVCDFCYRAYKGEVTQCPEYRKGMRVYHYTRQLETVYPRLTKPSLQKVEKLQQQQATVST